MTIKDISAQTGYSVGTISRVLNNQPNVSEKARTVILAAAEASGCSAAFWRRCRPGSPTCRIH